MGYLQVSPQADLWLLQIVPARAALGPAQPSLHPDYHPLDSLSYHPHLCWLLAAASQQSHCHGTWYSPIMRFFTMLLECEITFGFSQTEHALQTRQQFNVSFLLVFWAFDHRSDGLK